jgi:transcriptional regulator with XRE-family HTH domain
MVRTMALSPEDQARRRRRERITQGEIAQRLRCAISRVSEYETGKKPLPWELTAEDYEHALEALIAERERESQ